MNTKDVYSEILNGNAVLITGSGANVEVKNHEGDDFPVGTKLPMLLYKECGIENPDDPYDLQDASQTFLERKSASELIALLKKTYNVGTLSDTVKTVYSLPWIRCYTTNYDDVPMLATDKNLIPITLNQSTNKYIDNSACCVYINGYIGKLDEKTLNTEFKLTTKSYLSIDNIVKSQWGSVLRDDLDIAKVIIVAGLSLDYDLDLKRILNDNELIKKVIFVEKEGISEDKKRKLGRFGTVWDVGLKQFANDINSFAKTEFVPQDKERRLICFERNYRKNMRQAATSNEVYELLMRGDWSDNIFWKENGKYKSLIYREQVFDVINAISKKIKLIYLHANLGNGKSIFLEMVKQQLFTKGISTYAFLEEKNKREIGDIETIISEAGQKVVIIENYFNHIDVLKSFSQHNCSDITFILTARTMVYEVKMVEVCNFFGVGSGQSVILDINKLNRKEILNCYNLIEKYEFWGKKTRLPKNEKRLLLTDKRKGNYELQSILLEVINSSTIKDRLDEIVKEIKQDSGDYYQCLILMLLAKVMSLELHITDINGITDTLGMNDVQFIHNSAVRELVILSDNGKMNFKIKSPITAQVILNGINNSADIIDALIKIAVYADRYSENVRFESVLQNIVSFSHVNSFLNGKRDNINFIMDYFNALKDIAYYKDNSFFWLQYSIACMRYRDYELAQNYIDVAYGKFRENGINVPFQCDNQQARIYLERIRQGRTENIRADFEKAHILIMKPITSEKDREETTIRLLKIYVDKSFIAQIKRENLMLLHKKYCGEAYNKVTMFLKNLKNERDRERYEFLKNELLKASVN